MKKDFDLMRKILIKIRESSELVIYNLSFDGYNNKEVYYNCQLLEEENLIIGCESLFAEDDVYEVAVQQLTSHGNDVLNNIQDENVWEETKEKTNTKKEETLSSLAKIAGTFIGNAIGGIINSN